MTKVYFTKAKLSDGEKTVSKIARKLVEKIVEENVMKLQKTIPLKIHFGEKGNNTFIRPENYQGIIGFLEEKKIKSIFMESGTLYGGQRYKKDLHLKTAKEHGFNQLPIVMADGEQGENFKEIEINQKHFETCKIAKEFTKYKQIIVLSHFKGHMLAGFGGAIKQLSMGHASKGGKLAMHMGIKPRIKKRKCVKCHMCEERCNENAITINEKTSNIDHDKCVGCGACFAICPNKAVTIMSLKSILHFIGIGNPFKEKLIEYAYAAQLGKENIYVNFAMNITKGCDCEPRHMKPVIPDIGIFASTDPVAIDKACYDKVLESGRKLKGFEQFAYAEKIGLGEIKYDIIEIK